MTKKRVYEIARERGLETRQVMRRLQQAGVEVKAAASTVSNEDIERVFGVRQEPVSPATQGLPSWLSPSASAVPKTTSKAAIDATREERSRKVEAQKSAKNKAVEQAKRLRAQMAEKRAQQEHSAAESAQRAVEADEAAEVAGAAETAQAVELAAQVVEPPSINGDVAELAATEVVAEPEIAAEVTVDGASDGGAIAEAFERAGEAAQEADEVEAVDEVTPDLALVDAEAVAEEIAVVEAELAAEVEEDGPPLTEAEQRRRAQKIAAQRVADQASKRRAQLEAEKLDVAQKERDKDKAAKKKDKKKKAEDGTTEEFIGSRKPRVGAASREPDADRGSRLGASKKRRVIIDAGATRKGGGGHQQGRGRGRGRGREKVEAAPIDPEIPVTIHAGATVKELSDALGVGSTEVIKVMMQGGDFVTITQSLSNEQIELVSIGLEPPREIIIKSAAEEEEIPVFEDTEEELITRAPVVTIMGHVDHGKTSLLDAIRETKVAVGEAGGITQHIGAYQVEVPHEKGLRRVTFLDTPGHEAFTALRARGAKVTDVAVLVVAADDGVKPQTIEAIDHARAADVPIVVAINKIDKDNAAIDKVKAELAQHGLNPWDGSTEMVEVSAKQRINLDDLIETILLQADVLELTANPDAESSGYVIESKLDPGRGPVCTMLVARGTLRVGDAIVAGAAWGKVRALNDFRGQRVKEAGPAMPVEIVGFDSVPDAGEFCMVVETERIARDKAQKRGQRLKAELLLKKRQRGMTLDDLFSRIKEGEIQDLNLIVKADVAGSIEAIEQELGKVKHSEVSVNIIHRGVGAINESDIMLASASTAIILGFNVRPNLEARQLADREGVDVRTYQIIYKLREDVENALSGMLSPEEVEETIGEAEVRQVFKASKVGAIAGCFVTNGKLERSASIRLVRDGTIVLDGKLSSLKRFKDDAREVAQGFECGLTIDGFNDIKEGDVIECYVIKQVERDITSELAGVTR